MKKLLVVMLTLLVLMGLISFSACAKDDGATYTVVAPDGAPALAIANLPSQIKINGDTVKLGKKVVPSSNIQTEALRDGVDMAVVPANLAGKICNSNAQYKILATVTNGNLYMTSSMSAQLSGLGDLVGKLVYSIGKSSVPDMIFKSLLAHEGIAYEEGEKPIEGKVVIKYCSDGSDVISQLALAKEKGELVFGIYGEPAVSKSMAKGFEEVMDLQDTWAKVTGDDNRGYAQAVLIARNNICENKELTARVLEAFIANTQSLLDNPSQSVENIKSVYPQTSLQSDMSAKVIQRCNVNTVIAVGEGRNYLERTLQVVLNLNPNAIGGKLPDDGSYMPTDFFVKN